MRVVFVLDSSCSFVYIANIFVGYQIITIRYKKEFSSRGTSTVHWCLCVYVWFLSFFFR